MTSATFDEKKRRASEYLDQSLTYLDNSEDAMRSAHPEKAGEFLWGSVATALKALAFAKKGKIITSHAEFWDLARELARETRDQSIYDNFREANSLHSNFYDSRLSSEDIRTVSSKIVNLVRKLRDLTLQALEEE